MGAVQDELREDDLSAAQEELAQRVLLLSEEVRLLHHPEELEPDGLCPVCRLEVGYECFSICCDRCDNCGDEPC